jgi:hypothetical protein
MGVLDEGAPEALPTSGGLRGRTLIALVPPAARESARDDLEVRSDPRPAAGDAPGRGHTALERPLRENVFTGSNTTAVSIPNSYLVTADADGRILRASPPIFKQY